MSLHSSPDNIPSELVSLKPTLYLFRTLVLLASLEGHRGRAMGQHRVWDPCVQRHRAGEDPLRPIALSMPGIVCHSGRGCGAQQ